MWWKQDADRLKILRTIFLEDSENDDENNYGDQIYNKLKDPNYKKLKK